MTRFECVSIVIVEFSRRLALAQQNIQFSWKKMPKDYNKEFAAACDLLSHDVCMYRA